MIARRSLMMAAERLPCFKAFMRETALPSGVRGPVDFSHGLWMWMVVRGVEAAGLMAFLQPVVAMI
ncbi:MAG: hypothetical protein HYS17_11995 [Micavibrio aeruginosavorus]|uniref:Uncharacterized protein n=1 Tax=Micavibrio aeruginosavorus TaxID=349221 RepID=A0A7T5R2D7_9BACT|nr:MAG: hypothetical protein HYS17_11995 [Micavibrio aeruginosavorus]